MKRPAIASMIASVLSGMIAFSCADSGEESLRRAVVLYKKGPSSSTIAGISRPGGDPFEIRRYAVNGRCTYPELQTRISGLLSIG